MCNFKYFLSVLFFLSFFITKPIYAQSNFLIWPIYPVLENEDKATPIWLENTGNKASMIQIRVFKWSQSDKKDIYSDQQEVIASPPIVKVAAGDKQMIRLTKLINFSDSKEYSYRIIIDELPVDLDSKDAANSVSFKMRYSLPLFVYGQGIGSGNSQVTNKSNSKNPNARPILNWSMIKKGNKDFIEIENTGLLSIKISGFQVNGKEYNSVSGNNSFGYVLSESKLDFHLSNDLKSLLLSGKSIYAVIGNNKKPLLINKK